MGMRLATAMDIAARNYRERRDRIALELLVALIHTDRALGGPEEMATWAYARADAMMAASDRGEHK